MKFKCTVCKIEFKRYSNLKSKTPCCSRDCWYKICAKNLGKWTNPETVAKRNKNKEFRKKISLGLIKHFEKKPRRNEPWYIEKYGIQYVPLKLNHSYAWKKISKRMLNKYKMCQWCGGKEINLDVHHIIPYRISKDNNEENLIVLCDKCHRLVEDKNIKLFNKNGVWYDVRESFRKEINELEERKKKNRFIVASKI